MLFSIRDARSSGSAPAGKLPRYGMMLGVVAVGLTTLAACGSSSDSGTHSSSAASSGRTTVTVWDQTNATSTPFLNKMISEYNASQTKYTVKHQFIAGSGDQFTPKILNGIRSGQSPNVILNDSDPASVSQIVATGKVVPLDDQLTTGREPLARADFSSGMLQASTVNSKLYSLPSEGGDYAIIYNKQMFSQAGIATPPTTWAELATDAKKLSTGGKFGIYLPIGTGEWPVYVWQGILAGEGGKLLSPDGKQAAFNSAAGVKALTTWTDMVKDGAAYPKSLEDTTQAQGVPGFAAKKVAMFAGNVYNIADADKAIGAANVGVFKFPQATQPGMMLGTNVSLMLKGTAQQQAGAWDFLSWFHQPTQQATWAAQTGYLPTNLKALTQPAWKTYVAKTPGVSVFANQLSYATTRPSITAYPEISTALDTALQNAMMGKQQPAAALDGAAKAANQALATQ